MEHEIELFAGGVAVDHNIFYAGDKVKIKITLYTKDMIFNGEIKFGIYPDDDDYPTHNHLGFYIEYIYTWKGRDGEESEICRASLMDAINKELLEIVEGEVNMNIGKW